MVWENKSKGLRVALTRSALREKAPGFEIPTAGARMRKGGLKAISTKRISKPLLRDNSAWHQSRNVDDWTIKNSPRLTRAHAIAENTMNLNPPADKLRVVPLTLRDVLQYIFDARLLPVNRESRSS